MCIRDRSHARFAVFFFNDTATTEIYTRSLVGSVTEIYDHLRLLFARIGIPHCPNGHAIERQTVQQIVDQVLALPEGTRLLVLGPLIKDRKTEGDRIFEAAQKQGFVRVRVDGETYDLSEAPTLDKYKR